jgi:mono/diheme cytochrome c family protein
MPFLKRLRQAGKPGRDALLLHGEALQRAETVFRGTAGVMPEVQIAMHAPFYTIDPEAIFACYADLPTLDRGLALFQQNCSVCHGPYGRGMTGWRVLADHDYVLGLSLSLRKSMTFCSCASAFNRTATA